MTYTAAGKMAFLALALFLAGALALAAAYPLLAAAPLPAPAPAAGPPAFLDAPDAVTLWLAAPATPAALLGHVTVRCGGEKIAVIRVEAVAGTESEREADSAEARAGEVVLAGTFQSLLGASDWQTDSRQTRMRAVAPGVYQFQAHLPAGHYEYKVARGGTWADSYGAGFEPGGANLPLDVPAGGATVLFQVDFSKRAIATSLDTPGLAAAAVAPDPASLPARVVRLTLARALTPAEIVRPMTVRVDGGGGGPARPVYARDALSAPEYYYGGGDLGAAYAPAATTFKVWSPVATAVELSLYRGAAGDAYRRVTLRRGAAGVWSATVAGDLAGVYYRYGFTSYGVRRGAPDLYGRAASADLRRSMVVDLARTDPAGWRVDAGPPLAAPTDAVVYECHVRDFTIDPSSGVPAPLRGTYLGMVAPGTHVPGTDAPTGLDYLRRLGVTHVHLLPFQSIAPHPGRAAGYNWGYETYLFDVPEPRYATDPADPAGVIREVKTMVSGLHRAGLGLVMDVVYNHTVPSGGDQSPFWATVPYYYFRTDARGRLLDESGVGNAVDDDHPMVRKYMVDSLSYWAEQYHVDGFRFDLMGMFEPATVAAVSRALHAVRPDILLYGEPWTGGGPIRFGKGAQRGLGVAVFNDEFRNLARGDLNGTKPGFALGGGGDPAALRSAVAGSPGFASAPTETMNYVSIHDDETLWDKIRQTLPDAGEAEQKRALKLAGAMVLLSQGVPILEGGAEMGRTKGGNPNSYAAGDAVNAFDWRRGLRFADVTDYYRALIAIRRAHPAFRQATAAGVSAALTFLPAASLPPSTVGFTLDGRASGDAWSQIMVLFHGGATDANVPAAPLDHWYRAVHGDRADPAGWTSSSDFALLNLPALSTLVLYRDGRPGVHGFTQIGDKAALPLPAARQDLAQP